MIEPPAHGLRIHTFQWSVGIFCALIGALMLVTPHQFASASYASFAPQLPGWGSMFIIAGAVLICATVLAPSRTIIVLAHCGAGVALLLLALGFLRAGGWTGGIVYGLLASGTVAAPFVSANSLARRDLLALVLALSAVLNGCVILLFPQQFTGIFYDQIHSVLFLYGIVFVVGGAALLVVQLAAVPRPLVWLGHGLCAAALWTWLGANSLPLRLYTGIAYYGGFGLILLLLPWLGPRLAHVDTAGLRLRLGLLLVGVAMLPLVAALSLATRQAEHLVLQQTLSLQQRLATTLAREVGSYVALHQSVVNALASESGLAALPPTAQRDRLQALGRTHPGFVVLQTFDAFGNAIARSDNSALSPSVAGDLFFEQARDTNAASFETRVSRVLGRPLLILATPLRAPSGDFSGVLVGAVDLDRLNQLLHVVEDGAGAIAFAVDAQGKVLASSDPQRLPFGADLADVAPLRALQTAGDQSGALRYTPAAGERVAGYAQVAEQSWGVVVETPAATALAAVRAGRELAFVMLVLLIGLAVLLGSLLSQQLARPLALLSAAASQLAQGAASAPLPQSGITEVRSLSQAFGAMRVRLTQRTAERDAAEAARLQLLEQERSARTAAEAAAARTLRLQAATAAFGNAVTSEQIAAVVANEGASALEAPAALMALCKDGWMEIIVAVGYAQPAVDAWQRFPLTAPVPLATAARTGQPVWVESAEQLAREYPAIVATPSTQTNSLAALPLFVQGRVVGAIGVSFHTQRRLPPDDRAFMVALAQQCAQALERAQLYEAERAARTQAEEAVQLRDVFLSVASHELRTPLTALLGNAQVLQRRVARTGTFTERDQRALEVVTQQGERLNRLLATLLDISRIETGRLSLQAEALDLAALAQRIVADLQDTLSRHALSYQGPPELALVGDVQRLEQVLQNLIQNAIKYSPAGGRVLVTLERCGDEAVLAVSDEGIGISPSALPQIFSRFFRAHAADLSYVSGFGIGLYVVNEVVSLHGGSVEVSSVEDQGSTFTVRLPLEGVRET
jgi:signal transduction histidine kinase